MLVATFGPTTTWVGKTVTYADGAFVLEGHGPIRAQDVFEFGRQGHLVWPMDGLRAWVGARAQAESGVAARPSHAVEWHADPPATAGTHQATTVGPPEQAVSALSAVPATEPADPAATAVVPDRAATAAAPDPAATAAALDTASGTPEDAFGGPGADDPERARQIEEAARKHDWARLAVLYEVQAWWLDEEGRDALQVTRLARRAELRALAETGVAQVGVAAADDDTCAACRRVGARVMTVADALRLMPIPNASCAYKWCRCRWERADAPREPAAKGREG